MIKSLNIFVFFLFLITNNVACKKNIKNSIAHFPKGKESMTDFFSKNMKWRQKQMTIEGNVYISFMVENDGNITNILIEKSLCSSCDKEAIRLIKMMPNWIPAKKKGKHIRSKIVLPVKFYL